jgi:hypothetical protein
MDRRIDRMPALRLGMAPDSDVDSVVAAQSKAADESTRSAGRL